MKRSIRVMAILAQVFVAAILFAGCGSDDPASPAKPAPQPFSGSYRYIQMTGTPYNITEPYRSETGIFETVRKDSLRFRTAYTALGGNIEGPIDPPARSLELLADRELALTDPGNLTVTGRYTPDGSVAVLHGDFSDGYVGFLMAARMNPDPTPDDLKGKWYLVQFGAGQAAAPATGMVGFGAVGTVEVDADGAVTFIDYDYIKGYQVNPLQVVHPASSLVPESYGTIMWRRTNMNLVEFVGGISADGNLILLGAVGGFGGQGGIRVLIRGGLISNGTELSGDYLCDGFTHLNLSSPRGPYPMYGKMALGGSGLGTWDVTFPPPITGPVTVNYSVDADSKVAVTVTQPILWGWSGPGGDYAVLVGPFQSGTAEPWFQAILR